MTPTASVGRAPVTARQAKPVGFRSLSTKFSVFTAVLLLWVIVCLFVFDLRNENINWFKWIGTCGLLVVVGLAIARFTIRLMARPLQLLETGIKSVIEGRPETIQVSKTGDEIEFLGHSFNGMIEKLIETENQVRQHQELLEERIRQRTEELEQTMHKAQAASQAKSEFLANMSHELRTPMNGVLGMIDIVLESALTPEQRDQLETAQRCAHSLLSLLNDVLDLSKIEAGKMVLERVPFDVRVLVDDVVRAHRPKAVKKGVTLNAEVAPDVPRRVTADPLRLRQIVSNLLSNSVKFTERGSVRLRLNQQPKEDGFDLVVEVTDTGVGIPADKLGIIFEKFTQADGSISRKYGGTGLGLTITRRLIEMHGGQISVNSTPGKGSCFRFAIPCAISVAERSVETIQERGITADRSVEMSHSAPILVVEDNLVNQKVVTAILRKRGYHVDVANHGREALEYLESLEYGIVLMDVQMPVLDGLEATRIIRKDPRFRSLPVIAMTAHAMAGDKERCLAAGMNAYVAKPLNPAGLLRVVEEYLIKSTHEVEEDLPEPAAFPIDSWLAANLANSDPALMLEMQRLFLQIAPERMDNLHRAFRRKDFSGMEIESKRLRSSAERIAAIKVAEAAAALEDSATRKDEDRVRQTLVTVEHEIDLTSRHLQRLCNAVN